MYNLDGIVCFLFAFCWMLLFEECILNIIFIFQALVENVRARMDDGAAIVLSAILKATRNKDKEVKIEKSGDLDSVSRSLEIYDVNIHVYWPIHIQIVITFLIYIIYIIYDDLMTA